jgi:hypothetical protein
MAVSDICIRVEKTIAGPKAENYESKAMLKRNHIIKRKNSDGDIKFPIRPEVMEILINRFVISELDTIERPSKINSLRTDFSEQEEHDSKMEGAASPSPRAHKLLDPMEFKTLQNFRASFNQRDLSGPLW